MRNLSLINLKLELENTYIYQNQIDNTINVLEVADSFNSKLVGICYYTEKFLFLEDFAKQHPRIMSESLFIENHAKDIVKEFHNRYPDRLIRYSYQPKNKCPHHAWISEYACIIGVYEKIDNKWRKTL